jgi:hypothetical protein
MQLSRRHIACSTQDESKEGCMTGFTVISTSKRSRTIRSRRSALVATMIAITGATGCVLTPYDNQHFGPNTTFTVQGVAFFASSQITVEARNQKTDVWEDVASTTSAATVTFPAGTWTNSPDLYAYSFNVQVANPCYWDPSCQLPPGSPSAKIRVREGSRTDGFYHFRGQFDSLSCTLARLSAGEDFFAAGLNCGYNDSVILLTAL